jgi:hypothetical protein
VAILPEAALQRFFRQSRRTLTWPKGTGFSGQNKKYGDILTPKIAEFR